MRRAIILLALLILAAPAAVFAQDKAGAQEQELTQLLQHFYAAIKQKDERFLTATMAKDHPVTQRTGVVKTREEWLADLRSGQTTFTDLSVSDVKVHLNGDTAVVTYLTHLKGRLAGQPLDAISRATRVFARRDGKWRSLAVHYTPAPER